MLTLPVGSSKNPDLLNREHKAYLETELATMGSRIRENFKDFVREAHPTILPFAMLIAEADRKVALMAIPFTGQLPTSVIADTLAEVAQKSGALCAIITYDAFTTFGKKGEIDFTTSDLSKLDISTRKDSIVTVWTTIWGKGSVTVVRYSRTSNGGAEFEPPITLTTSLGVFDSIFPAKGKQVN
jgi:hypothetical protein